LSSTIPIGAESEALVAAIPSPLYVPEPLPAIVEMMPEALTLRMRLPFVSAM
jgi:hypothetical protein